MALGWPPALRVVCHPMVEAQVVAGHDKGEEIVKVKVLVVVGIWWSWMFG